MKVSLETLEVDDRLRRAIAHHMGRDGLATRSMVREFVREAVDREMNKALGYYEPVEQRLENQRRIEQEQRKLRLSDRRSESLSDYASELGIEGEVVHAPDHNIYLISGKGKKRLGFNIGEARKNLEKIAG